MPGGGADQNRHKAIFVYVELSAGAEVVHFTPLKRFMAPTNDRSGVIVEGTFALNLIDFPAG